MARFGTVKTIVILDFADDQKPTTNDGFYDLGQNLRNHEPRRRIGCC